MGRAYNVIDADGHILEPLDLWDKYIDRKFRDRAPKVVKAENGKERLVIEERAARPSRLAAGGRRIRTLGPTSEDSIFSRPPRIRRRQTGPVASAGFDDRQVQVYPSPSQAGPGNDIHAGSPASRRRQRRAVPAWPLFGL
jgi:hypothetical protein